MAQQVSQGLSTWYNLETIESMYSKHLPYNLALVSEVPMLFHTFGLRKSLYSGGFKRSNSCALRTTREGKG